MYIRACASTYASAWGCVCEGICKSGCVYERICIGGILCVRLDVYVRKKMCMCEIRVCRCMQASDYTPVNVHVLMGGYSTADQ